jgi:hypothetical protein
MRKPLTYFQFLPALALAALAMSAISFGQQQPASPIRFELKSLPFQLDSSQTPAKNMPETMAGGAAVFDYNNDGRPDIFFTNGADIATLKKSSPKYFNRLYRNDGNGVFTDVTAKAGLQGTGFDIGVAVGDYDNDGFPDLFVAGVHGNTLYHNNGDGTFTDVTKKAGLDKWNDPEYGPLWAVAAAWVDVNNDGLLDLFVVNYLQWAYSDQPKCITEAVAEYCHPRYYKGQPNQLFLNQGDGTFKDVSKEWGIRDHVGKGMGVGMADYDQDGKPDLFVTNDSEYNFLFHNLGNRFEEVAFQTNVALAEDAAFISGMGVDFRDVNNDGYPDLVYVALKSQTFPLYLNTGKGDFADVTTSSGLRAGALRLRQRWMERSVCVARTCDLGLASRIQICGAQYRLSQPGGKREMGGAYQRSRIHRSNSSTPSRLRLRRLRRKWPHRYGRDESRPACRAVDEPQPQP